MPTYPMFYCPIYFCWDSGKQFLGLSELLFDIQTEEIIDWFILHT